MDQCGILCKGEALTVPENEITTGIIELESWYTSEMGQWRYPAGLASRKQTASDRFCSYWEKSICKIYICMCLLIYSSGETTCGRAASVGAITQLSLCYSTVVLQDPSVSRTGPIGELNGDVVGITTSAFLESLVVALICIPSLKAVLLSAYSFPR